MRKDSHSSRSGGFVKVLLAMAVASIVAAVAYQYYQESVIGYSGQPQQVQLTFHPSQFKGQIDEELALPVLEHPYRYHREFKQLVHQLHTAVIDHLANRLGVPDSLRMRMHQAYAKRHEWVSELIFDDYTRLRDTAAAFYEAWYQTLATKAVDRFYEVTARYTCTVIHAVVAEVFPDEQGLVWVKGLQADSPCGVALSEALRPMIRRLEERARIQDFARSKGMLEQKLTRTLAELATVEVRDRKGLSKQMQTRLFGFAISETEMQVSAMSILKVGFRLDKYFALRVVPATKEVVVTLPEPEILSHEVYPRIDELNIGWLREIGRTDFNENFELLREALREEAVRDGRVFDQAKRKATELLDAMLGPLLAALDGYRLRVEFRPTPPSSPDRLYLESPFESLSPPALDTAGVLPSFR